MTAAHDNFAQWCTDELARVEAALSQWIAADAPANLGAPMRYAVLDGGKRLRPLLVLAACAAVDGHQEAALRAACAVELIHAYSLVHDDMPCMDNDVLRRGKPTVHVRFGQAQALLAGDALQALAFELLTPEDGVPPAMQASLCRLLAQAAGADGMAGGQAIDLQNVGKAMTQAQLEHMHGLKTGALIRAAVALGALACADIGDSQLAQLDTYAAKLGLAFQVIDDVLDCEADTATLGKTAGKDAQADKPTYVQLLGLAAARAYAETLVAEAIAALAAFDARADYLRALAEFVTARKH